VAEFTTLNILWNFPDVFPTHKRRNPSFTHPDLKGAVRVTDVIDKKDVLLHFPYHSFNAILDLLREAAIDPDVSSIKITAYRLASDSKVINALINASRNGKKVEVMLEVKSTIRRRGKFGMEKCTGGRGREGCFRHPQYESARKNIVS